MRALAIVEREVFRQPQCQFRPIDIPLEINVLMLEASPQPFHKDVVQRPAPPTCLPRFAWRRQVHADADLFAPEHPGEGRAAKLRALIAVKDLWCAMAS